jgi:hypothetical protein
VPGTPRRNTAAFAGPDRVRDDELSSLDEAAGRLLLALLYLRDAGDALGMSAALRGYAAAGRREDADLASLESELVVLHDAVFRVAPDDPSAAARRASYVALLAGHYREAP